MSQLMLLRLADKAIVGGPYDEGQRVPLPGNADATLVAPAIAAWEGDGYRLVVLVEVGFARPGPYYTQGADTGQLSGDGLTWTVTRAWTAWTQTEIDTYEAARLDGIATAFDDVDDLERAAVLVIMDETNRHAATLQAILNAARNATNLATFQTAMNAIAAVPQRTAADMKTAIRAKLGS